jgi:predicted ArsR family transcriptional regulator
MDEPPPRIAHSATHESLLRTLRREGPLPLAGIAERMGLSRSAVLYHLRLLSRSGMVERRSVRHGVGRPHDIYDITLRAQALPPDDYRGLASSLLAAAREIGGPALETRIFEERRRAQVALFRRRMEDDGLVAAPIFERTEALATWLDELGYECSVDRRGAVRLVEHHCPVMDVAAVTHAVCNAELQCIADVLDADAVRETCIGAGARTCTYRVRARAWDSRGWDTSQYTAAHAEETSGQRGPQTA